MYGFVRVGAASPQLAVADCAYNRQEILKSIAAAEENQVQVLTLPELCLTGYTCGDLFLQNALLRGAEDSLQQILEATAHSRMFVVLGMPLAVGNQLFNVAVALQQGKILGVVPKTHIPNYSEFYEKRWFSSGTVTKTAEIYLCGQTVPFGTDLLFSAGNLSTLTIAIELCEDLWVPIPPSSYQSLQGATLLLNLSASNELAAKDGYRKALVSQQSARCIAGYVYASAGMGESTQDAVFSGHSLIYENGALLAESRRFARDNQLIVTDIDTEALTNDRRKNTSFVCSTDLNAYRLVPFSIWERETEHLARRIQSMPFIPKADEHRARRCEDIFTIQVTALAKRLAHTHAQSAVIGISGGLDSTLALLVTAKAYDFLGWDRKGIIAVTMPGFGTTDRTYQNALRLMETLGVTMREISIRESVLQHFADIGHNPENHNVVYENAQARERTQILMDIANQTNGLVVGTGDLSELALGWATYNGDHMSMYGVNAGIPKTLVRVLVQWAAESEALGEAGSAVLMDVLDTPVSPELLPPDAEGKIDQKTEEIVGPYTLHDFFLYYVVRFGFSPAKILYLAEQAFRDEYDRDTLLLWLKNFYRRFFNQQFKRSCLPDGPKVGTINLSPRGDWRMPSDAVSRLWLEELEQL